MLFAQITEQRWRLVADNSDGGGQSGCPAITNGLATRVEKDLH
jgi:hypothetical protein